MVKKGIDVSYAQGKIDWAKVKTDFAIIRGGYGRYEVDKQFNNNYNGCKENKIPCGVYHYSYADTTAKAKQEADFVISYLKGKQFEYPICYDVEDKTQSKLSKQELTDIARVFLERVQAAGYYVCLYSSKSWLETKFDLKQLPYDIWVAQWNNTCTYTGSYGIWQYTDNAKINGMTVDGDYAYKDYPEIIKSKRLNGFKTEAKKSINDIAKEVLEGKWGNGNERKKRLSAAGYSYEAVQARVNQLLGLNVNNKYKKGQPIKLSNTPLYASSTAKNPSGRRTGLYYIYDGISVNGRYRITYSQALCGKKPESRYVSGWIKGE